MTRRVIYTNGNTYKNNQEASIWRRNSSLEIVDWLNSLPGREINGKKIREVVNFQIIIRNPWECFALVEFDD
jgi:hypothetical protein